MKIKTGYAIYIRECLEHFKDVKFEYLMQNYTIHISNYILNL